MLLSASIFKPYILTWCLQMYGPSNIFGRRAQENSTNNRDNGSNGNQGCGFFGQTSQGDNLGTYRLNGYKDTDGPSALMISVMAAWRELQPFSIATKEKTIHLSVVELRIEDYYLIRNKKLKDIHTNQMQKWLNQTCFNQQLISNGHCTKLLPFSSDRPIDIDALKNQPTISNSNDNNSSYRGYNTNNTNTYGNNGNSNQGNYNAFSTNYNSRSNTSNSNQNSNNVFSRNSQPSESNRGIFSNNSNQSGNGNNANNSNSMQGGNIFNSQNKPNNNTNSNIFNNSANGNNNSSGSNGNTSNNIFNTNSNNGSNNNSGNGSSNNMFNNFGGGIQGNNSQNRNTFNSNNFNNTNNNQNGTNSQNNRFANHGNNNSNNAPSNNAFNNNNSSNNLVSNHSNNNSNNSNNLFNGNQNQNNTNNIFNNQTTSNHQNNQQNNGNNSNQLFQSNQSNNSLFTNNPSFNQSSNGMPMFANNSFDLLYSQAALFDGIIKQIEQRVIDKLSPFESQRRQMSQSYGGNFSSQYSSRQQDSFDEPFFTMKLAKNKAEDQAIQVAVVYQKNTNQSNHNQARKSQHPQSILNQGSSLLPVQSRVKKNQESLFKSIKMDKNASIYGTKKCESFLVHNFQAKHVCSVRLQVKWVDNIKDIPSEKIAIIKSDIYLPSLDFSTQESRKHLISILKKDFPVIRSDAKLVLEQHQHQSFRDHRQVVIVGIIEQRIFNLDMNQYDVYFSSIRKGRIYNFTLTKRTKEVTTATISWETPISYESLDFSDPETFDLEVSEVVCNLPALNSKCRITFGQLPLKIFKLFKSSGKRVANDNLRALIESKNQQEKIFEFCTIHDDGSWTLIINKFD